MDALGRSGVLFAWHPSDDVLLYCKNNQLLRLDFAGQTKPLPAVLAPDWGRLNGDYLAFTRDGSAVLVGLLPSGAAPTATRSVAGPGPARRRTAAPTVAARGVRERSGHPPQRPRALAARRRHGDFPHPR